MKTIYYIIKEIENKKHFAYSLTENGAYITDGTFETKEEAKFFITETCKPIYYENFSSSYNLIETTEDSKEMVEVVKKVEAVYDFLTTEIEKPSFKIFMFFHNVKEAFKKIYNMLFFPSLN